MSGKNGSVILFLRNLPDNVTNKRLKQFVQQELKRAGVRGLPLRSPCSNCSILRITDPARGTEEYHGLLEIQPSRIAMQAMEVLNGKRIAGKPVEVRRYRHRSPWGGHGNAQDIAIMPPQDAHPLGERRRDNLKIELVDETPCAESVVGIPALN